MIYSQAMSRLDAWMTERDRILVMGIVNVTPDSFHDGGRFLDPDAAIARALQMEAEGADVLDVGGESTRPGSRSVTAQEEIDRIAPVIEGIRRRSDLPISIDTTKAAVAREALGAGAAIVNDVGALRFDEAMAGTVADAGACVVLMHMLGSPETMQVDPSYGDVVGEIDAFFAERIDAAIDAGIERGRILIDPGIGFGKRLADNLSILRGLERFASHGVPIAVGASRKSFLGAILDLPSDERLEGTIVANAVAILHGADIIRVHDVKEGVRTAAVAARLRSDDATNR